MCRPGSGSDSTCTGSGCIGLDFFGPNLSSSLNLVFNSSPSSSFRSCQRAGVLTGGRCRFPSSRWRPPWPRPSQWSLPLTAQPIPGLQVIVLLHKVNSHAAVHRTSTSWPNCVCTLVFWTQMCLYLGVPAGFLPLHGGFRDHFVETPEGKYCCEACRLVLCQPRQTECGHRFCQSCISDILRWDTHSESQTGRQEVVSRCRLKE